VRTQGTLFGPNTIGGANLYNSKSPHDEFEYEVILEVGGLDHRFAWLVINAPLSDTFFSRLAVMTRQQDRYVDMDAYEYD
jgi:iron complex outermembrane receptor protein